MSLTNLSGFTEATLKKSLRMPAKNIPHFDCSCFYQSGCHVVSQTINLDLCRTLLSTECMYQSQDRKHQVKASLASETSCQ